MWKFAYYAVGTVFTPATAMKKLLCEARPVAAAARSVGFVGALYAASSLALALTGAVPMAPVFLQIRPENYYVWQTIFAVPYVLLVWMMTAGVIHFLGRRKQAVTPFERAAALAGAALAGSLFMAWLPLAFAAFFLVIGMSQEELVDLISNPGGWQAFYLFLQILAGIAAVILLPLAAGQGRIQKAGRWRALGAGLVAAAVLAGTYVIFIR